MAITAQMVKELREITSAGMMDCKRTLVETNGDIEEAIKLLREKGLAKAAKKVGRIAAEGITSFKISDCMKKGVVLELNSETDFVAKNPDFVGFAEEINKMQLSADYKSIDELKKAKFTAGEIDVETALNELIAKIGENMSLRRIDSLEIENGYIFGYLHGAGKIAVLVSIESNAEYDKLTELGKDIAMQVAAMSPKFLYIDDVDQEYLENEKKIQLQAALNEGKPENIAQKMVEGRIKKEMREICLFEQIFVKDSDHTIKTLVQEKAKELNAEIKIKNFIRYELGLGIEKKEENFAEEVAKQISN